MTSADLLREEAAKLSRQANGDGYYTIARRFGVDRMTIARIDQNLIWRHVT